MRSVLLAASVAMVACSGEPYGTAPSPHATDTDKPEPRQRRLPEQQTTSPTQIADAGANHVGCEPQSVTWAVGIASCAATLTQPLATGAHASLSDGEGDARGTVTATCDNGKLA